MRGITQGSSAAVRKAWIAVTVAFILNGLAVGTFVSRIPDFKRQFEVSDGKFGFSLFFVSAGVMSALRPSGILCSRWGSKKVAIIGSIAIALSLFPISLAHSYLLFCLALYFFGFANAAQDIAINSHAVALEELSQQRMMSTFHGMWSLGALVGGACGAVAIRFQIHFLAQYSIIFLFVILLIFYSGKKYLSHEVDKKKETKKRQKSTPKIIWFLGLMGLCSSLGEGSASDWGGILAKDSYHASAFVSTLPYIVFMSGMIIGRFTGDKLAEIFGVRKLLMFNGGLFATGFTLGVVSGKTTIEIISWGLVGVGVAAVIPIIVSSTGSIVLSKYSEAISPAEAVSIVTAVNYSGFFFGPPLMGFLADHFSLRGALLLPAILGVGLIFLSRKIVNW